MSKKLFVGSLSWDTDDSGLRAAFEQFGEVTEAKVITERDTGRSPAAARRLERYEAVCRGWFKRRCRLVSRAKNRTFWRSKL